MTLNQSSIPKPDIGRKLRFCPCRNIAITFWIEKLEWCGCPTVKEFLKTEYTNVTDRRTDIHRTTAQAALTHSIARIKNDDRPMWKYCRWHENQKLDVNTSHKFYCSTFDVNVCSETQSPLTSTWPHLRSDVGSEEGNIEKKLSLCYTILCTIIMAHKRTRSSYRSVDCIGLLILLGLALCFPSASVSSVFMALYR